MTATNAGDKQKRDYVAFIGSLFFFKALRAFRRARCREHSRHSMAPPAWKGVRRGLKNRRPGVQKRKPRQISPPGGSQIGLPAPWGVLGARSALGGKGGVEKYYGCVCLGPFSTLFIVLCCLPCCVAGGAAHMQKYSNSISFCVSQAICAYFSQRQKQLNFRGHA